MKDNYKNNFINENIKKMNSLSSLVLIIFFILLTIISCNKNPVEPKDNTQPGSRDYVWTVDTIPVHNASMRDIWGSSPTNIWICGDAYNRRESLWHFDGTTFTPSGEYILWPSAIWGTSYDNIWLGTASSQLWHYNGIKWTKHTDLKFPGYSDVVISSIIGTSANNVYAVGMADSDYGYRGIILHYNGNEWKFIYTTNIRVNFFKINYDIFSDSYLVAAANFDNIGSSERVYILKNNILNELYSGQILTGLGISGQNSYVYQVNNYTSDKKIYLYENNSLNLKIDLSNTHYAGRIWGRSEKDFFCVNWGDEQELGGIGHYNGKELITIYPFKGMIPNAVIFEKDVFFIGSYSWTDNAQVFIRGNIND